MNTKNLRNSVKKKQCYFCKKEVLLEYPFRHGNKSCICEKCFKLYIIPETHKKYNKENIETWVECGICGLRGKEISIHVKKSHRETLENYKIEHGSTKSTEMGKKNPFYNHEGKLSPFSRNNTKITEKQRQENIKTVTESMAKNGNIPTTIEYFLKKTDGNLDKAKELLNERQSTFSKEICIENHGEDLGLEVWQDRQNRWQETLNNKSIEEKLRINRLKTAKGYSISKAEIEISKALGLTESAQCCIDPNKGYVYDIVTGKKIIEYNGDYWHMNPTKWATNDFNRRVGKTAEDIWAKDKEKIDFAKSLGYEVLVIWESDYNKNKQATIDKCINFLMQ